MELFAVSNDENNEPAAGSQHHNQAASGSTDRLAGMLSRGAQARESAVPEESGDGDWANEDLYAVAELPYRQRPVTRFLARRGGRPKTRSALTSQVNQLCGFVADITGREIGVGGATTYPWHLFDADDADVFRSQMFNRYPNIGSRNLMISLLREIMKECRRSRLISGVRLESLLERLPLKSPGRSSRGRRLSDKDIEKLLVACARDANSRCGARDSAIIATFLTTGLRASELVSLQLSDWDPERRTLHARVTKNGDPHTVFVNTAAASHLVAWLCIRGDWAGPLFCMVKGDKQQRISYAAVRELLGTRADQAGIPRFGSHDFRRTLATNLLRVHDVSLVSKLLGHRDVASTAIYDMADEEDCRRAVESAHVPGIETLRQCQRDEDASEDAEAPSSDGVGIIGDDSGAAA